MANTTEKRPCNPAETASSDGVGLSSDVLFSPWAVRSYKSGVLKETVIDDSRGNILARIHGTEEQAQLMASAPGLRTERDHWKCKYKQLNKELMCELRDPNGTIWEHAKKLQNERDALKAALIEMRYGHTDLAEKMAADALGENAKLNRRPDDGTN